MSDAPLSSVGKYDPSVGKLGEAGVCVALEYDMCPIPPPVVADRGGGWFDGVSAGKGT